MHVSHEDGRYKSAGVFGFHLVVDTQRDGCEEEIASVPERGYRKDTETVHTLKPES